MQKWLREQYRSAPSEGPEAKRMKFSDMYTDLSSRFSSTNFNPKMISQEIKGAFPDTYSKAVGKGRVKHVFGIERATQAQDSTSQCEGLRERVRQLEDRVRELEQHQEFSHEMNSLLAPNLSLYHGPNNITNFDSFTMDSMVEELVKISPTLYDLFKTLGQTSRHADDEGTDVTAVMSLCTLLKCRSQKVLGVQLLITLMLLARSTNKQVRTSAPANVINNHIYTEGPKYCCMKESDLDFFSRLSQF